jgi:hypothetical protein
VSNPDKPPPPIAPAPGHSDPPHPAGAPKRPPSPGKPAPEDAGPSVVPEAPPADQEDPRGDEDQSEKQPS